jgi:hypothetical protein
MRRTASGGAVPIPARGHARKRGNDSVSARDDSSRRLVPELSQGQGRPWPAREAPPRPCHKSCARAGARCCCLAAPTSGQGAPRYPALLATARPGAGLPRPAMARASSVVVTICEITGEIDDSGSEEPASARASSVLETGPFGGVLAVVGATVLPANVRASSVVVGMGLARATDPAATKNVSAAPTERTSFESPCLVVIV